MIRNNEMKILFSILALTVAVGQTSLAESCRPTMAIELEKAKQAPTCFKSCIKTLNTMALVMSEQHYLRPEQIMAITHNRLKRGILGDDSDYSATAAYNFLEQIGILKNNFVRITEEPTCKPTVADAVARAKAATTCGLSCMDTIHSIEMTVTDVPGLTAQQYLADAQYVYYFSLEDAVRFLAELGLLENNYTRVKN